MFKLLALLMAIPATGIALGFGLSRTKRRFGPALLVLCLSVCARAVWITRLSTLYPGPASRYLADAAARHVRDDIVGPLMLIWPALAVLLLATLAYFVHRKRAPVTRSQYFEAAI